MLLDDALDDPMLAEMALQRLAAKIQTTRAHASGALADARLRVERTREHIADLEHRVEEWRQSQQPSVRQAEGGRLVGVSHSGPPLPRMINLIIGESVQNLRTSLDYLIYGLAWLDSGRHQNRRSSP